MTPGRRALLQGLACGALVSSLPGLARAKARPQLVLIIDDLGYALEAGLRVARLPAPVVAAVLPHTPHARALATAAHGRGKEVMLHLPMQADSRSAPIGRGGIYLDTQRAELRETLQAALDSVPHVVGVNNHMGSLVTRHPGLMLWLMEELADRPPLYWVDSRTTPETVAELKAHRLQVPTLRRDVFLDHQPTARGVAAEFARLKALAQARGTAVGIGHPYPVTLDYLEQALPGLEAEGFAVVSPRTLLHGPIEAALARRRAALAG